MQALNNIISKLEGFRNNYTEEIKALHISTSDNPANTSHLKDAETTLKKQLETESRRDKGLCK